jgi:hypothetical protein
MTAFFVVEGSESFEKKKKKNSVVAIVATGNLMTTLELYLTFLLEYRKTSYFINEVKLRRYLFTNIFRTFDIYMILV